MSEHYCLRPIWDSLLCIYKEIEGICNKYHLRCYAAYGTALGAVRHKGFIPWDDDFDVVMPRSDYMKFLEIATDVLPSNLQIESPYVNPQCHTTFSKVRESREHEVERIKRESGLSLEQGLFVDIFPLDGYPRAIVPFWWWAFRRALVRRLFGTNRLYMDRWCSKFDYDKYDCVYCTMANLRDLKKRLVTRDTFGDGLVVPFENTTIRIPFDCDTHLKNAYGDYMELPPVDKRHPTHQLIAGAHQKESKS